MILPDEEIVAVTPSREYFPIKVEYYPGGEPMIKDDPDDEIHALIVRPKSMDTLLAALFLIEVWEDRDRLGIELILPYFPGARQDRVNIKGDVLFTARSVARLINNTSNILTVKILDPHSDVVLALLTQCRWYDNTLAWGPERDASGWDYDGVIAPDGGAVRRATKVAELLNAKEFLHGWKHRNVASGEITSFGLEAPRKIGGHYLVVDDICDGGGTFLGLADEIKRNLITADLFVTHGIFSSPANLFLLKKRYGTIYTTDSRVGLHELTESVHVIPTVERML